MSGQTPAPKDPLPATLLGCGIGGLALVLLGRLFGGRAGFLLTSAGLVLTVGCGLLFFAVAYWPGER